MRVGQLEVEITADDTKLRRSLGNVDKSLSATAKRVGSIATAFAKVGAVAVTAMAAVGTAVVRSQLKSIDALAKTSQKLNVAIEDLQALRFAAEQTGVGANTLDMALQRMTRRVSEAAVGTGEAVKALQELGLDAQYLATLSPDQAFNKIATAMDGVATQGDRVRLAMRLFDTEGVALVNTLQGGEASLQAFKKEAQDLGLVLTNVDAAKVEAANDALNRINQVIKGGLQQSTVEIAPYIEAIADHFTNVAREAGGLGNIIVPQIRSIVVGIAKFGDQLDNIAIGFKHVQVVSAQMGTFVIGNLKEVAKVANSIMKGIAIGQNMLIDGMNKIPGIEIPLIDMNIEGVIAGLDKMGINAKEQVIGLKSEIIELQKQANSAESVGDMFDKIQKDAQAAAEAAQNRPSTSGSILLPEQSGAPIASNAQLEEIAKLGLSKLDLINTQEKERLTALETFNQEELAMLGGMEEAKRKILADSDAQRALLDQADRNRRMLNLESIREASMTEGQLMAEQYMLELETLTESLENKELTKQEYEKLREDMAQQHADKLVAIEEARVQAEIQAEERLKQQKLSATSQTFSSLSSLMNTGSKKLFAIGKAAAKAGAIVDGYAAVSKTMASVPYPFNIPLAAAQAAASAVQVRQINAQQFGGGGSAVSFSGGLPAVNTQQAGQQQAQPQRNVSINLQGSNFSAEQVRALIGQINEQVGDGVLIA